MDLQDKKVLLAGCGELGLYLGCLLQEHGFDVTGLKRTPVEEPPFPLICADLMDVDSLQPLASQYDFIVYTATPDAVTPDGYQAAYVTGLRHLLTATATPKEKLLLVSSTGVYGQSAGEWVNEESVTEPSRFSGKILLESEALAQELCPVTTIVRFSGIYGPGRLRNIRKARQGSQVIENPPQYTNRIHCDDCVGVLAFLIAEQLNGVELAPVYLASDCDPAPEHEVLDFIAQTLNIDSPPREIPADSEVVTLNKRCSNKRLLQLGYEFHFPSYKDGYRQVMQVEGLI
ncbi:MAG: SDR family oxidoreductase [Pseudomonadales bacterium]|nr:SDR family oxidoreductase [Pseudomonadales bacterium]